MVEKPRKAPGRAPPSADDPMTYAKRIVLQYSRSMHAWLDYMKYHHRLLHSHTKF